MAELAKAGKVLSRREYGRLRDGVGALLAEGRAEAEAAVGHALASAYWKVGRRIREAGLTERAGYGAGVLSDLAEDLEISLRNLQHAVRFAGLFERAPQPGLSWAHYRELLGVADAEARGVLLEAALEQGWSRRQLAGAIARGADGGGEGAGRGPGGKPKLVRPTDGNYLYRCQVARVIDGDTLLVHVDLGFEVLRVQRLRLVNVSAPEAKTRAGKEATRFVRTQLAQAETVVVKTARSSDARGRYLAHVFYSGEWDDADTVMREGRYLNAELLRSGHGKLDLDRASRPNT